MTTFLGDLDCTFDDVLEPIDWEPGSPSPGTQVNVQVVRFVVVFADLRATREEGDRVYWRSGTPSRDVPW